MVKCEDHYRKKVITGITVVLSIFILLFLVAWYEILSQSVSEKQIYIETKLDPIVDSDYPVYRVHSSSYLQDQVSASLYLESEGKEPYGKNINTLHLDVIYVDKDIIRITIRDSKKKQWAVNDLNYTSKYSINNYEFKLISYPFSFEVIRKSDKMRLFSTAGMSFYFSSRYLEIETFANEKRTSFGIGERKGKYKLSEGSYFIWPRSENPGHHPFYFEINEKQTHGVYLHNFHAMEIIYSANSMKFKTIGGILDLFVILGRSTEEVIRNYHKINGLPSLPLFSALGYYHGGSFESEEKLSTVLNRYKDNSFPYDGIFISRNYMNNNLTFTVNNDFSNINSVIANEKQQGRQVVVEVLSGLTTNSEVFQNFANNLLAYTGNTSIGPSGFIDWYTPNVSKLWSAALSSFHTKINYDGLFLTENEVFTTNFANKSSIPLLYTPNNMILDSYTIPINTVHWNSYLEIDLHSLFGSQQVYNTHNYLETVKRPLIVSENTRPGMKAFRVFSEYSEWTSLRDSIPSVLAFEMFGIRSGADICGFYGADKAEMCSFWHQLAVFYPFMRYYKSEKYYTGLENLETIKPSVLLRYSLVLYIYSLYFEASLHGGTVLRPMFFEFDDSSLLNYSDQIMLGPALFGVFSVYDKNQGIAVYLPSSKWYNIRTDSVEVGKSNIKNFYLSSDSIILLRSGFIIPWLDSDKALSLNDMRNKDIRLIVALDDNFFAKGTFYTDDGVSVDTLIRKKFTKVVCKAEFKDKLVISIVSVIGGYSQQFRKIESIKVFGARQPSSVKVGNESFEFSFNNGVILISTNIETYAKTEININF